MTDFKNDFAKFISENNVVGVTAGVIIGYSAKDTITSFVTDIFLPLFIIFLHKLKFKSIMRFLPGKGKNQMDIAKFVGQFISFILLSIITFFFLTFTFNKLLNVPKKKK